MFAVGDLVVCIDDRFSPVAYQCCPHLPRRGEVYTVQAVGVGRCYVTGIRGAGLRLVELSNPPLPKPWKGEPCFSAYRFKALGISEHVRVRESVTVGVPR